MSLYIPSLPKGEEEGNSQMTYEAIVHHGTDKRSAELIKEAQFNLSVGDRHWLGDGVYYFENNPKMAYEWSKAEGYKRKYNEYSILESNLVVEFADLLNLDEPEDAELFHQHRELLVQRIKEASFSVRSRNQKVLDGKVLNDLCSLVPFKVIRSSLFIKMVNDRICCIDSRISNCKVVAVRDLRCIGLTRIVEEGYLNDVWKTQ